MTWKFCWYPLFIMKILCLLRKQMNLGSDDECHRRCGDLNIKLGHKMRRARIVHYQVVVKNNMQLYTQKKAIYLIRSIKLSAVQNPRRFILSIGASLEF